MKKRKNVLALFLAVLMMISLFPVTVFAEGSSEILPPENNEEMGESLAIVLQRISALPSVEELPDMTKEALTALLDEVEAIFVLTDELTPEEQEKIDFSKLTAMYAAYDYLDDTSAENPVPTPEFSITNRMQEKDKEKNHGFITVQEKAEEGETVWVTVTPNEGFRLKSLMYFPDESQGAAPLNSETLSGNLLPGQMDFCGPEAPASLPVSEDNLVRPEEAAFLIDGERGNYHIGFDALDLGPYRLSMPDYPIIIEAQFELVSPVWTDWEPFDSGKGSWTYYVLFSGVVPSTEDQIWVRHDRTHEKIKQIKVDDWGKGLFIENYEGFDLILNWDESTNIVSIPAQSTGCYLDVFDENLYIQDFNSFAVVSPSINPSEYDAAAKTFKIPVIYYLPDSRIYFGFGNETLKMLDPGKLQYDAEKEDFSAVFGSDDTKLSFDDESALVSATDSANKTTAICVILEKGSTEIPAGVYIIDKTLAPGTVRASSGVIDGRYVSYSFAGNRNASGIYPPIWFLVNGKVTVSYSGQVMTMVVDAENSFGRDIDITINKFIPREFEVIDDTTDVNGAVSVDQNPAKEGSTVTLTVIPNDGYRLRTGTLKAVYDDGTGEKTLELTQDPAEKSKYTFTMPTADVSVTAEFEEADATFKAVWNTSTKVLSFFYDKRTHINDGISVYDELPTEAASAADWFYDGIREDVESVEIDASAADYTGLKSTAYMFAGMMQAESIIGAEYLKTDQVTNMAHTFSGFGFGSEALNAVPDVSGWNTGNVTDMSGMFAFYGYSSLMLDAVPEVCAWQTGNVTDLSQMFSNYGNSSEVLSEVPDVSSWQTGNVTDLSELFQYYGYSSENLNFELNLANWDIMKTTAGRNVFLDAAVNAAEWSVTIPEKTGEKANDVGHWYLSDGTTFIKPAADREFNFPKAQIAEPLFGKVRNYATLDKALEAAKPFDIVKLLTDITDRTADILIPESVTLDLNDHVFKTTGKLENRGGIRVYQKNADIIEEMLVHIPGIYSAAEELKLPDSAAPDYVVPKGAFVTIEDEGSPAFRNLRFAIDDTNLLVWKTDVPAGTHLTVMYRMKLGGDIPGTEKKDARATKVTVNKLMLETDVTVGSSGSGGEAVLAVESLYDDFMGDTLGAFTPNGKKIILNDTGKFVISSDIAFDESVIISGVPGKVVSKQENTTDKTVTYVLSMPAPPTGDHSRMPLWTVLLILTGGAVIGLLAFERKKKA